MIERYTSGETLRAPRVRDFEIEPRHVFSSTEIYFDRIIANSRLSFCSLPEYRAMIDNVAWQNAVSGSSEFVRRFNKMHVMRSGFSWPWLEECHAMFAKDGVFPRYWAIKQQDTPLSPATSFAEWSRCVEHLTYVSREIDNMREALEVMPHWIVSVRSAYPDCPIHTDSALRLSSHAHAAILADDLEALLPSFPADGPIVEVGSERSLKRRFSAL